jgi:hypothetical protein
MNKISGNSVLPSLKSTGFGKSRANFSQYHLLAGQNAASTATEIENKYKSKILSQKDRDLHLSQVSTAIICSVAALESNINEYLTDHEKYIDKAPAISDPRLLKKYTFNKNKLSSQLLQSTNIIFKYNLIWFITKNDLLPENENKRSLRYLTRLRNALTHFTPEWGNNLLKHIKLEKNRQNRFTLSPFYPPGGLFFPHRCLSASCAIWSCKVSNEFIELFKSIIG